MQTNARAKNTKQNKTHTQTASYVTHPKLQLASQLLQSPRDLSCFLCLCRRLPVLVSVFCSEMRPDSQLAVSGKLLLSLFLQHLTLLLRTQGSFCYLGEKPVDVDHPNAGPRLVLRQALLDQRHRKQVGDSNRSLKQNGWCGEGP